VPPARNAVHNPCVSPCLSKPLRSLFSVCNPFTCRAANERNMVPTSEHERFYLHLRSVTRPQIRDLVCTLAAHAARGVPQLNATWSPHPNTKSLLTLAKGDTSRHLPPCVHASRARLTCGTLLKFLRLASAHRLGHTHLQRQRVGKPPSWHT
jgi:hypothetical protein